MAQVRLRNHIGKTSLVGQIVKLDPKDSTSYVLAELTDIGVIGTVATSVPNNYRGLVNRINTVDWSDIVNKVESSVTKESVEAVLTGAITSHTHPGDSSPTFESVSKNISSYPYTLTYDGTTLASITYDIGDGDSIVKTLNYTDGKLTSIVLSGDTPDGISLTKTLSYTGENLTGITYS